MDAYQVFNSVNQSYVHFRRMHQFEPHKLYKFFDIKETNHPQYGQGYMAFVMDHRNVKYKVQLPSKYLRQLVLPDHINVYLTDITKNKNPFLVYRRQLDDSSFVIEIKKFDADLMYKFRNNKPLPETLNCLPDNEVMPAPNVTPDSDTGLDNDHESGYSEDISGKIDGSGSGNGLTLKRVHSGELDDETEKSPTKVSKLPKKGNAEGSGN